MSDPANHSDPVVQAVLGLLRRLPLKWRQLDNDNITAAEQEALKLLTAAGLVERRFALRLSLLGHPVCVEAVITVTGEFGLAEAGEPVASAAWQAWAEAYLKQKNEDTEARPRFHCEKMGPEMARLTDQGQIALKDVQAGEAATVLDFVYHRGPVFAGRAVPGDGRAERIRTTAASPPSSLDVQVTNLPEVAGPLAAIAETLNKLFEKHAAAASNVARESIGRDEGAGNVFDGSRAATGAFTTKAAALVFSPTNLDSGISTSCSASRGGLSRLHSSAPIAIARPSGRAWSPRRKPLRRSSPVPPDPVRWWTRKRSPSFNKPSTI